MSAKSLIISLIVIVAMVTVIVNTIDGDGSILGGIGDFIANIFGGLMPDDGITIGSGQ